jgi:hypothetical protein
MDDTDCRQQPICQEADAPMCPNMADRPDAAMRRVPWANQDTASGETTRQKRSLSILLWLSGFGVAALVSAAATLPFCILAARFNLITNDFFIACLAYCPPLTGFLVGLVIWPRLPQRWADSRDQFLGGTFAGA